MKAFKIGDIVLYEGSPHLVSGIVGKSDRVYVELQHLTRLPSLIPLDQVGQEAAYEQSSPLYLPQRHQQLLEKAHLYISLLTALEAMGAPIDNYSPQIDEYCQELQDLYGQAVEGKSVLDRVRACRTVLMGEALS